MIEVMEIILYVLIGAFVLLICPGWFLFVTWGTHLSMAKYESGGKLPIVWLSWKDFVKMFDEWDWERIDAFPGSLFAHPSKIHAEIVRFDDTVYRFYPWSFLPFRLWQRRMKRK